PVLLQPQLSGRRRRRPARLPRGRAALCVRHLRRARAELAGDPGHPGRAGPVRGDDGLLAGLRARRRAGGRGPAGLAGLWRGPGLHRLRRRPERRRAPDAGHVRAGRDGRLPPPRPGRHPVALERRGGGAAAPRRRAGMPMIDGEMQAFPLTLDRLLDHAAKSHPDAEVVPGRGAAAGVKRLGYAQVLLRAMRVSNLLAGLGVGRGDKVATLAWNSQAHVEVWYAIMGMGAVCHTLNPRLTESQLGAMAASSGARLLIASADLAPLARRIAARAPAVQRVLVIDAPAELGDEPDGAPPLQRLEPLLAEAGETEMWGGFDETAPSGLCF